MLLSLINLIKQLGADHKNRYDFFSCYTDALKDFIVRLDEEESVGLENLNESEIKSKNETQKEKSIFNHKNSPPSAKYYINGKPFTLDQVKEYAHKPYTNEQLEVNKERLELSKKLFEQLKSKECKV